MKKTILSLLLLFQLTLSFAQVKPLLFTIKATITAEDTGKALSFATVFNKRLFTGTASNLAGYFELPNNRIGDTIVVAYLGYEDKIVVVSKNTPSELQLSPRSALLDEVVVIAKSDYLYDIVAKVRKNKRTKARVAKTYFFLETQIAEETVELIESYYNGEYSDLGIDELNIKKGRIGLKPMNKRYFRSTESSTLFSKHDLFAKTKLFPKSPLSIKKKALKKAYRLKLSHTFLEDQAKIYVIDFVPKKETRDLFSGSIWIDQTNNRLIKIKLEIEDADVHPFIPIGFNTIEAVDMEVTKSFETIENDQYINTIDFNYKVSYADKWGNRIKASTKAFTKAYDYQAEFKLPNFEFSKHLHEDYRNITVAPYDSVFWNRTAEFRFYDRLQEIEDFILQHKIESSVMYSAHQKDSLFSRLQFPYISWDKDRFKMTQASANVIEKSKRTRAFATDRFNFSVKLYLDVNRVQDGLIYQIQAILDPIKTYYHFYLTNTDRAFMNMYFDLMEIEKRKFISTLSLTPNPSEAFIEKLYQQHLAAFEASGKRFIEETNRGKNLEKMEGWNDYILNSLGINNIEEFKITVDE
ncbi:MAG: carboxypeptidase-like regulatory domain-containing protein [Saprospiraceae bacterium]